MKIKHRLFIFAIGLTIQSHGQGNPNGSVDTLIQSEMNLEHFPGVSTIIVKNGEILWVESYGYFEGGVFRKS
jgi:hypothetical protein